MGPEKPNPTLGDNLAKWQRNNANLYSLVFLATNGGATTVVRRHEGKKPEDGLGDGQEAWKAREDKFDAVSNDTRRELYNELAQTKVKEGQDPDDPLYIVETARDRLRDMWEHISPDRFGARIHNAPTPDYNFVRNTSFRAREVGLRDIKSTVRYMYVDLLSRLSTKPSIAGRGVAMQIKITSKVCSDTSAGSLDTTRSSTPTTTPSSTRPGKKGLPSGAPCTKLRLIPTMRAEQKERRIL